eukprot:SAG31_NODE_9089_length_1335_cov_0.750404_1_plen_77_part_00
MTSNIYVVKSVNTVDLKSIGSALRVQVPPWISKTNPEAALVPPQASPMGVPGQPWELAERSKGFKCIAFGIGGSLG